MEAQPENNFTAVVLVRTLHDSSVGSVMDECIIISEDMWGDGFPYPKNCREDIADLLSILRAEYAFEDLEPIDICEIVTEDGRTLWNEGDDKNAFTT